MKAYSQQNPPTQLSALTDSVAFPEGKGMRRRKYVSPADLKAKLHRKKELAKLDPYLDECCRDTRLEIKKLG
eukprot:836893-Rhodomonas_salina.2